MGQDRWVLLVHRAESILGIPLVEDTLWIVLLVGNVHIDFSLVMVQLNLFVDEFLVFWDFETIKFKIEIEVSDGITCGLVIDEVELLHVWMGKGLLDRDSLGGVEGEHSLDEVDGLRVLSSLEELGKVFASLVGELLHKGSVVNVLDLLDQVGVWLTNEVRNHHHLFLLILSWKKWLPSDKFSQNAANTPNID